MAQDQPVVTDESPWWQKLLKLNPAVIRGVLVAVLAVVAQVLGHTIVSDGMIDLIINAFTAIAPLLAGILIRPAVTPNAKVETYKPDPVSSPDVVVAGDASSVQTGVIVEPANPSVPDDVAVPALAHLDAEPGDNEPVPPADDPTGGGINTAGDADVPDRLTEADLAARDGVDAEIPDTDDVEDLGPADDEGVPGIPDDQQGSDVSEADK